MAESARADVVLCLNVGSSSLKFALFRVTRLAEEPLASGAIEQLGSEQARAVLKQAAQHTERACPSLGLLESLGVVFEMFGEQGLPKPSVVGHRVVHGGREHSAPSLIDAARWAA